jgi:Na+-translocating ferredoxin:NAD+ oxidoreductase RnfC subunit
LKVEEYETETPFRKIDYSPSKVRIKLLQHAGKPAHGVVKEAERVKKGALVALVDEPDLGVGIHSSIDGTVRAVTDQWIEIEANSTERGGGVT